MPALSTRAGPDSRYASGRTARWTAHHSLHVHHSDDEAWHVLEGSLHFRFRVAYRVSGQGPALVVIIQAEVCGRGSRTSIGVTS